MFIIVCKQSCSVAVSHAASEAALLSHSVTALHVCDLSANHDEPRARYLIMLLAHAVRAARNGASLATSQHGYTVYELIAPVPPITLVFFMRGMIGWPGEVGRGNVERVLHNVVCTIVAQLCTKCAPSCSIVAHLCTVGHTTVSN